MSYGIDSDPPTADQLDRAAAARPAKMNPWTPMSRPIDQKHLGKLIEELNECGAAAARCLIQGIAEREPVTGKPNADWLEEEIADVLANIGLVQHHFALNAGRIERRTFSKMAQLREWHAMLETAQ